MTNPVVLHVIFHSKFKVSFKLINQKVKSEKQKPKLIKRKFKKLKNKKQKPNLMK